MRKDVYITQDNATAHTNKQFLLPSSNAVGEPVIYNWPPNSPHLVLHDFYLCNLLRDKIFVNNPCMLRKRKRDIPVTLNISQEVGCPFFPYLLCFKVTMINVISSNDKKDCGHCS